MDGIDGGIDACDGSLEVSLAEVGSYVVDGIDGSIDVINKRGQSVMGETLEVLPCLDEVIGDAFGIGECFLQVTLLDLLQELKDRFPDCFIVKVE